MILMQQSICKRANIRYVSFHALRHIFATRLIENGVDIKTVSKLLGHSDVFVTLNTYVHDTLDSKRNATDILGDQFKNLMSVNWRSFFMLTVQYCQLYSPVKVLSKQKRQVHEFPQSLVYQCFIKLLTKSIRRVLYLTVIYLRIRLPVCFSDLPKTWRAATMCLYPVLLQVGFTWLPQSPEERWALTSPFHPYLYKYRRSISVALSLELPPLGVTQHPALWSTDVPQVPPFGIVLATIWLT